MAILANKLGLLIDITRNEPRDLYDIWFLLQRVKQFDFSLTRVLQIFKEKYSFKPTLSLLRSYLQGATSQTHWENRLAKQIAFLPTMNEVIEESIQNLEVLFGRYA